MIPRSPRARALLSLAGLSVAAGCGGSDAPAGPGQDGNEPPSVSIASPDDGATFLAGTPVTFEGSAEDPEEGSLEGGDLTWTSDVDGELGTGRSVTVSDLSTGDHAVTLRAVDREGASSTATVSIAVETNDPPSASIASPADGSVFGEGAPVEFRGSATDPQAGDLTGGSLRWASDVDGELGTGESVTRTDLSVATHTVRFVAEDPQGRADTATISVTVEENGQPTATIASPADGASFTEGAPVTFEGSGSDPEDGRLSGGSLTWRSSLDGELGTGDTVTRDDLSDGLHTVTLTARDSRGAADSARIEVEVSGDPTATISSPSEESIFAGGEAVTLRGSATDPVEGRLTGRSLEWSSDVDGILGTGETVTVSDLSGGPHRVTLTATDRDGNQATASVDVLVETSGFDVRVRFADDFTADQRLLVRNAVEPWEEAVTGDLSPLFPSPEQARDCGTSERGIDDLLTVVRIADIDGPGGVLARAGPCLARMDEGGDFTTPVSGVVTIDRADLGNPQLDQIVTHELGHVLGIGIDPLEGWGSSAKTVDPRDPFFTGTSAVEAFREDLDGQAYLSEGVPLENVGGQGTAGAHWREQNFATELMTGFINPGVTNPLSVVSVASLADIGYRVDVSAAESFSLPMPQAALWEAEADATLSRPASSGQNFGVPGGPPLSEAVVVGSNNEQLWSSDPESEVFTGLVRFGVPSRPSGVEIGGATLLLTVRDRNSETTGHEVQVVEVTGSWSEADVSWDGRPSFGSAPVLSFPHDALGPSVSSSAFTELVRQWSSGAKANHGLALRAPDAVGDATFSVGYWTREASNARVRPRVEVEATVESTAGRRVGGAPGAGGTIDLGADVRRGVLVGVGPAGRTLRRVRIR